MEPSNTMPTSSRRAPRETAAVEIFVDQDFSYTDAVSFAAMRRTGITQAFGFDRQFVTASFALIP